MKWTWRDGGLSIVLSSNFNCLFPSLRAKASDKLWACLRICKTVILIHPPVSTCYSPSVVGTIKGDHWCKNAWPKCSRQGNYYQILKNLIIITLSWALGSGIFTSVISFDCPNNGGGVASGDRRMDKYHCFADTETGSEFVTCFCS